jgi:hypothetical protein
MHNVTVKTCEAANTFKNDHGEFQVWKLSITSDGQDLNGVEINTKLGKNGPSIGETFEGTLTKSAYGWKLKRIQQNGGRLGGGRNPQDTRQIVRQHSQEMAILWTATLAKEGKLKEDSLTPDGLKRLITWFQSDAEATS